MLHARHALVIRAPPAAVWAVVSKPARAAEWSFGVRRVEPVTDAKNGVGAQWRETVVLGLVAGARIIEVTREEPERALRVESATRPRFEATYSLGIADGGTRFEAEVEMELPLGRAARVAEPAIGAAFARLVARRSAERLKRVVERSAGRDPARANAFGEAW